MKEVRCTNCQALFGKESSGVLTIKYRDLYRSIEGKVSGPCRSCGNIVLWASKPKDNR